MKLHIVLGLITICFSTVLALRCHQCEYKYNSNEECKQNITKCPLQCGSITVYNDDSALNSNTRGCIDPALCVIDGKTFGQNKTIFNPQCCGTDLCNSEEAPALLRYSNELQCYSCDIFNKDCSKLVTCSGDQKCFTLEGGITGITMKGCADNIICGDGILNTLVSLSGTQTKCCERMLCNNVQVLEQNLILLLVPLLSLLFL